MIMNLYDLIKLIKKVVKVILMQFYCKGSAKLLETHLDIPKMIMDNS